MASDDLFRQVRPSAAAEALGGADAPGEIAEVDIFTATASPHWKLYLELDGKPLLGMPSPWLVRPGRPDPTRCLLEAPWVATGKAAAGVRHEGTLRLRDLTGNEADGAGVHVRIVLREDFEWREPLEPLEPELRDEIDVFYPERAQTPRALAKKKASEAPDFDKPDAPPKPRIRESEFEATYLSGGMYRIAWTAVHAGPHTVLVYADGELLQCSRLVHVHADGVSAATSVLHSPPGKRLLPQSWSILQMRCRDASGNAAELLDPSRLAIKCEGLASEAHVQVRELP